MHQMMMFSFYDIEYMGAQFVVLESKAAVHLTPAQCKKLTSNLSAVLGKPCVIMFDQLASYERNRYIEQGVYFVVSGKYVFLPFFLINGRYTVSGAPSAEGLRQALLELAAQEQTEVASGMQCGPDGCRIG